MVTHLEELGNGDASKNHVTLYRDLLSRYGLDPIDGLADKLYQQGLVQLALGWNAQDFFPEIVGFNLAYEGLPLHLLITAYELNELGIDPYYISLHVTVDNAELANPDEAGDFLKALEKMGWIQKNQPAVCSRFWNLLEGDRAEMVGVFSPYELQVIHDWIRGAFSADGASFEATAGTASTPAAPRRPISFRVAERLRLAKGIQPIRNTESLDADISLFQEHYPLLGATAQRDLLLQAMSPAMHWTPTGLHATQIFIGA